MKAKQKGNITNKEFNTHLALGQIFLGVKDPTG